MTDETILILTAGFGEGHNSAARAIETAILRRSEGRVSVVTADLFDDAAPRLARLCKSGYRWVTCHAPALWNLFFKLTERDTFENNWWDAFVGLRRALERRLAETGARRVVLTFPLYAYFPPLSGADPAKRPEVFTVVTDSITIHPVWLRSRADRLFVTDEFTREIVAASPLCRQTPEATGFPVSPAFRDPAEEAEDDPAPGAPLKILFFACASKAHVLASLESLARAFPEDLELTVVTGKREAELRPALERLLAAFPLRSLKILGWTTEAPVLMRAHHAVISKAGGATVHECLAAGAPVFLNYVVPGQEEGNARLMERLGTGMRIPSPEQTGPLVAAARADGTLAEMRRNMRKHRRADGAFRVADAVLRGILSPSPHD